MTAIYAYACDQIAFVAGDTLRVTPDFFPRRVTKVHRWSDTVVFAQAGEAQFLTGLLGRVLPLAGFHPLTAQGFIEAFSLLHGKFWREAEDFYAKKIAGPVPEGTVLVAEAATEKREAGIYKIDFRTANVHGSKNRTGADGTNPSEFQAQADKHLASLLANAEGNKLPLDIWAWRCVSDAARLFPKFISAPVDCLIARHSPADSRITVQSRIIAEPKALDLFQAT